jgi:hypothetical protein
MTTRPTNLSPIRGSEPAAFGGILLALAVGVTEARLDDEWGTGLLFALALIAAVALLAAGLTAAGQDRRPTAVASCLLLAGLALWAIADFRLFDVLSGGDGDAFDRPSAVTGFFALLSVVALGCWWRSGSAACLLVGALAAGGTLISAVNWISDSEDIATYRPVLLVLAVAFSLVAAVLRRDDRHRDVMVDAAGLSILSIAALDGGFFIFFFGGHSPDAWEAVLLAGGIALVAYSLVTRAPGPALIALLVLASFALSALSLGESGGEEVAGHGLDLAGWPIVLFVMSLATFAFGIVRGRSETMSEA